MSDRMRGWAAFALASVVLGIGCGDDATRPGPLVSPNVILIEIDSLRADRVGGDASATPRLDRLAAAGARFEFALAPSSQSIPSIVTLLTSLPPEQHRVMDGEHALASEAVTLAEVMRDRGFATAAFVAGERFAAGRGLEQGFGSWSWVSPGASPDRSGEIAAWLARWKQAGPSQPFFLFAHIPLETPRPAHEPRSETAYAKLVRDADERAGRIVDAIDAIDAGNGTLVVATSDRGFDFEGPASLREASVRVPLIFRYASRLDAGGRFSDVARTMDIGPTIMMLARVRRPEAFGFRHPAYGFEMRDLTEVLIGVPPNKEMAATGFDPDGSQSFRQGSYILMRKPGASLRDPFDFFDLARDPAELHDLFEAEPMRAGAYAKKLGAWEALCAERPHYAIPFRPTPP